MAKNLRERTAYGKKEGRSLNSPLLYICRGGARLYGKRCNTDSLDDVMYSIQLCVYVCAGDFSLGKICTHTAFDRVSLVYHYYCNIHVYVRKKFMEIDGNARVRAPFLMPVSSI